MTGTETSTQISVTYIYYVIVVHQKCAYYMQINSAKKQVLFEGK